MVSPHNDRAALTSLLEEIEGFYLTDRAMLRAQKTMRAILATEAAPSAHAVSAYLAAVERYFTGFEREARAHLADLDRRLGRVSQLQFNLTAERGVAARRVEATQGVLSRLPERAPR